jgi:hypothetical protein
MKMEGERERRGRKKEDLAKRRRIDASLSPKYLLR